MALAAHKSHSSMSFVTIATSDSSPTFQISRLAELFIETLLYYRARGHYKLHAYLVMPDRIHLLITPQFTPLDQTIALIQRGFANRCHTTDEIWEPVFTEHPIPDLRTLESLRTYLHQTPVRAGLSLIAELYPYSSARRLAQRIAPLPATTLVLESAS
jgi:putative transposase